MNIGKRIKMLRQEHHMTQEALACQLGISAQAVSKWEQGVTAPDISLLGDIAEQFLITTDELLGVRAYRSKSGYRSYRERLLAIYEAGGPEDAFQRAAAAYEDVLLRGAPETRDYMLYGYLYNCRAKRDAQVALRYYEQALEQGESDRDDDWFQVHQQISILYAQQGRADEAVDRWKAWQDREPDNVYANLAVIWALYWANRPEEALSYTEIALALAPDSPEVLYARGEILGGIHGLKRYEEALEYWNRAEQRSEGRFGDARWSRAYAYEQLGRYADAIREFEELCAWLREQGYDAGVETQEPEEQIQRLKEKL